MEDVEPLPFLEGNLAVALAHLAETSQAIEQHRNALLYTVLAGFAPGSTVQISDMVDFTHAHVDYLWVVWDGAGCFLKDEQSKL